MPLPLELRTARRDFDAFMVASRDHAMLQTKHPAYTMLEGVFRVFRSRRTIGEALSFAQVLPPLLRAIFVKDWDVTSPVKPFGTRAEMMAEVRALRPDHNLSTPTAIADVAAVLNSMSTKTP